ncbi:expressed unknown protein [Seminavis robusta]|uniref:Uncharacterized protein n=1 Tax=Seminavis robusta TaxID=568900 RepID=A0A9N8DYQ1_9STRA|nr:expressed unknown protein [Seminavis robusta]|eukprot:Sro348_g123160.1 n/a (254) ;mRNA; f:12615-13524
MTLYYELSSWVYFAYPRITPMDSSFVVVTNAAIELSSEIRRRTAWDHCVEYQVQPERANRKPSGDETYKVIPQLDSPCQLFGGIHGTSIRCTAPCECPTRCTNGECVSVYSSHNGNLGNTKTNMTIFMSMATITTLTPKSTTIVTGNVIKRPYDRTIPNTGCDLDKNCDGYVSYEETAGTCLPESLAWMVLPPSLLGNVVLATKMVHNTVHFLKDCVRLLQSLHLVPLHIASQSAFVRANTKSPRLQPNGGLE